MKQHASLLLVLLLGPSAFAAEKAEPAALLDAGQMMSAISGLGLVLAVVLALAWLVKRFAITPGVGRGAVQILGGVSLGPRERAVLVSVEGQKLLLGVAQGNVRTLHILDKDETSETDETENFQAQLQKVSDQNGNGEAS